MSGFDMAASPVTSFLLVVNLIVSGYALTTPGQMDALCLNTAAHFRLKQYYRLISSGFVHADPFHFLFNMTTLFFFGPAVERMLGPVGFVLLYFGALLAAGFLALYHNRADPLYSAVGASGAISGVLFSFCLFLPFAQIHVFFLPIGIPAFLYAFLFVIISLYFMNDIHSGQRGGIAHEAHLGGAIAGLALTLVMAYDRIYWFNL